MILPAASLTTFTPTAFLNCFNELRQQVVKPSVKVGLSLEFRKGLDALCDITKGHVTLYFWRVQLHDRDKHSTNFIECDMFTQDVLLSSNRCH